MYLMRFEKNGLSHPISHYIVICQHYDVYLAFISQNRTSNELYALQYAVAVVYVINCIFFNQYRLQSFHFYDELQQQNGSFWGSIAVAISVWNSFNSLKMGLRCKNLKISHANFFFIIEIFANLMTFRKCPQFLSKGEISFRINIYKKIM